MDVLAVLLIYMIAGMAAYSISVYLGKGGVYGSATVTLVAGVCFRYLETEGLIPLTGLAVVATCASYAGMAAQKNVANLKEMAVVGLLAGALFLVSENVFTGVGGRLGTIAAIACLSWMGLKTLSGFWSFSSPVKY